MRLKIKDIKEGNKFWECSGGRCVEVVAGCDAFQEDEGWVVFGTLIKDETNTAVRFFVADGYEHYGPRLYTEKAYT